jgi:hypothetical protein
MRNLERIVIPPLNHALKSQRSLSPPIQIVRPTLSVASHCYFHAETSGARLARKLRAMSGERDDVEAFRSRGILIQFSEVTLESLKAQSN